jgi:hypothetical protein
MRVVARRGLGSFVIGALPWIAGVAAASEIPMRNWTAPATWSVSAAEREPGTRTAFAAGQPVPLIPVTPCRIADTRDGSFPAGFGPPSLVGAAAARIFAIPSGPCAGIPADAAAYSLNFTVVAPFGTPAGGYLTVFPTGGTQPIVSTLNFTSGSILANAAVVPAGTAGSISLFVNFSTHVIIDVNGYYASSLTSSQTFTINTSSLYGIYGQSTTGTGVFGSAAGTGKVFGVEGSITAAAAAGAAGVHGIGAVTAGKSYGVLGENNSLVPDSAAILGAMTGGGAVVGLPAPAWIPTGVRGQSAFAGVLGFGNAFGVIGYAYGTSGAQAGYGVLGNNASDTTTIGVFGAAGNAGSTTNWAVYALGDMGATGAKPFVEPHPQRADLVIRYVALEGPEAGTYFRGRGRFSGRTAAIEVPESFRLVTDEEGMTVQVTPVGDLAQVAVVSMGLDVIELKSSRDVEFFFTVNGVRKTFKDWKVIVPGGEFVPDGPEARMPIGLSAEQKRNLVRNGTYNEDGTVNMATARRLGWDREWALRAPSSSAGKVAAPSEQR